MSSLSSAVAAALAGVNHSLADLVRWSDQLLLHDDFHHNTRSAQDVVEAVRDAVKVCLHALKQKLLLPLPPEVSEIAEHIVE